MTSWRLGVRRVASASISQRDALLQRCNRTLFLTLCVQMKIFSLAVALFVASHVSVGSAWSTRPGLFPRRAVAPPSLRRAQVIRAASAAAATPDGDSASKELTPAEAKKEERRKQVKKEGGRFAFNTKYGALNPFAIYYGVTAILLGLPWFVALTICQLLYTITGNRFDKYVSFIEMMLCLALIDDQSVG